MGNIYSAEVHKNSDNDDEGGSDVESMAGYNNFTIGNYIKYNKKHPEYLEYSDEGIVEIQQKDEENDFWIKTPCLYMTIEKGEIPGELVLKRD